MKYRSVRVTVTAVTEEGEPLEASWDLSPDTLRIETLREMEGMPHPIEPEVLRALPVKLKVQGYVEMAAKA